MEEIKQEILNVRQELVYMRERILHPEWIDKVGKMIDKLDTIVSRVELPVILELAEDEKQILKALLVSKMLEFKQALKDDIFFDDKDEQRLNTQLDKMYAIVSKLSK